MTEHALLTATTIRLRDGRTTTIRPLNPDDRPALLAFGHALPPEELLYMQDDFSSPEVISRLTGACAADHWRQFLAVAGDMVVGYGAALRLAGWSSHVAEIQLIVSRGWRRGGLGTAMAPV